MPFSFSSLNSLAFRVGAPLLAVFTLAGLLLYWFSLRPVAEFAAARVNEDVTNLSREIYTVCDRHLTEFLYGGRKSGGAGERIERAHALMEIEQLVRLRQGAAVVAENGEALLDMGGMSKAMAAAGENKVTAVAWNGKVFYALRTRFEPWQWEIVAFREAAAYDKIEQEVRFAHLSAAAVLAGALLLLYGGLYWNVTRRVGSIVAAVRRNEAPQPSGVRELAYLSEAIGRMMRLSQERLDRLVELNQTLEQRVAKEVAESREKDLMLIRQSRLAGMGEMIGNIAHQWRQPINALTLLLANIKDAYEYGELDQESLDKSVKDGQAIILKMSSTIDDFRNFFKPAKEKVPFSVNEAVADAAHILEAALKSAGIALSVEGGEGVMAYGYRNEYSQVLVNLLANAKEAIQEREVSHGEIRIRISGRERRAEVAVEDNAGGIAPEALPRIFDPYFTTKEKGTGIGLYMSKMIIENGMDGRIEVRNTGEGAEFVIATPLAAACEA